MCYAAVMKKFMLEGIVVEKKEAVENKETAEKEEAVENKETAEKEETLEEKFPLKKPAAKKRVYWEFNADTATISVSENSVLADNEKRFSFVLVKYKDPETHEESLEIKSFRDNAENGSIMTSLVKLKSDITQLLKYGVLLSKIDFESLSLAIFDNYLSLEDTTVTVGSDVRFNDLLFMAKDYFAASKDFVDQEFCYMPVGHFNELASECGYSTVEMKALREKLAKDKLIRVQSKRYAILCRIKGRPERVICFFREKLRVKLPEDFQE